MADLTGAELEAQRKLHPVLRQHPVAPDQELRGVIGRILGIARDPVEVRDPPPVPEDVDAGSDGVIVREHHIRSEAESEAHDAAIGQAVTVPNVHPRYGGQQVQPHSEPGLGVTRRTRIFRGVDSLCMGTRKRHGNEAEDQCSPAQNHIGYHIVGIQTFPGGQIAYQS